MNSLNPITDQRNSGLPAEHRPVDEVANFVTHALGLALSVLASVLLLVLCYRNPDSISITACGLYCATLVSLYAASTLSHAFHDPAWRRFFRTLDQMCIYLLIAGSFTPFGVAYLWYGWWRLLLVMMWFLAIFGACVVFALRNLTPVARLTYGLLGWLPALSLHVLLSEAPPQIVAWLVAGGICYSFGAIFLAFDHRVRYFHALWHTFVIGGSICHYVAILNSIT